MNRHRCIHLVALLVSVASVAKAGISAAEDGALKWKFPVGVSRKYQKELTTVFKAPPGAGKDATSVLRVDTTMTGKSWDEAAGTGQIILKVTRVYLTSPGPGTGFELDTDKDLPLDDTAKKMGNEVFKTLKNSEILCTVDECGTLKEATFEDKVDAVIKTAPKPSDVEIADLKRKLVEFLSPLTIVAPTKAEGNKSTWTGESKEVGILPNATKTTTYERKGTVSMQGRTFDKIELKSTMKTGPSDPNSNVTFRLKSFEGSGEMTFDKENGCIEEMTTTEKQVFEVTANAGPSENRNEMKMTLKRIDK